MIENADQIPWPVWIDKNSRIIFMKEKPGAVKTLFENKEAGLKTITALILRGYKVG